MHEVGLCQGLVALIDEQAAGRRVTRVTLRVGARHAVLADAFDQAFALVAAGTAADGAALDLMVTPVTVTCRACGHWAETVDTLPVCARCGMADVELTGGDELMLESLEFTPAREESLDVSRHPG